MFSSSKKTQQALTALQNEVNELRNQVLEATVQAEADRQGMASLLEKVVAMDSRITGMGAELSRQLHELGTDIEKLQANDTEDAILDTIHSLKTSQIRLATEQARYEITFRQDLAALANELLKRTR